jgi:hypothetical protein
MFLHTAEMWSFIFEKFQHARVTVHQLWEAPVRKVRVMSRADYGNIAFRCLKWQVMVIFFNVNMSVDIFILGMITCASISL